MGSGKRPTRRDVAEQAGVSTAVVSYVLNNGPRPVAEATRQRVLDAVRTLDYLPNEIARSLAGQRTKTIGLIAPTLANPVWARVSMGITDVICEQGYLLIVCDVEDDPEQDARYAQLLVSKQVDGVVLVPTADAAETVKVCRRGGVSVVVVEQDVAGASAVVVDAEATGRKVTEHLIELGHSRIAILREHRTSLDSWKRFAGYECAMAAAGLTVDDRLVADAHPSIDGSVVAGSLDAAAALLSVDPPPTAVVAHNDLMAIAVLHIARGLGLRVPDDLSVIGVDDVESALYAEPPLTTLPFPQRDLGRIAARQLLIQMAGEESHGLTVLDPPDVVVRGSTAPPPPNRRPEDQNPMR